MPVRSFTLFFCVCFLWQETWHYVKMRFVLEYCITQQGGFGVKRKSVLAQTTAYVLILLPFAFSVFVAGCAEKPDFDDLKAALEERLEKNRGNTEVGNADIYRITSLQIVNTLSEGKKDYTIEYKGEVECTADLYLSAEGKHSIKQPPWKSKRHITKGTRFEFAGSMRYASTLTGWKIRDNIVTMRPGYGPPL